jgi:hypothetical protein
MQAFYEKETYDDFVEYLYEKHLDDIGWDADIDLDILDRLIDNSKENRNPVEDKYGLNKALEKEKYFDALAEMEEVYLEHHEFVKEEDDKEGFELIVQKTGIMEPF